VTLLEAIILGLVQGLTEFLPISSSGHLVLAKEILGVSTQMDTHIGITFEVFVHFGTLLAIGTIFWNDILKLIKAFFSIFPILFSDQKFETRYCNNSYFRMMILIIAGSLPAGIIGLLLEDTIEEAFNNPVLVCIMLLLTGGILIASKFFLNGQKQLNASTALAIGFAQAVAIIPGISRSGSTICTGLMMGLEREESARFSFLLAVPVIAMATILKLSDLIATPPDATTIINLIVGTIVAYIAGYIAIKILLAVVRRGRLDRFAYYCFAASIIGLIILLF